MYFNGCVAFKDLDAEVDINVGLERIKLNIKMSAKKNLGHCKL
jgi:hypothetical protein